jgi:S-adenosylmethionine hydrolase
MLPCFQPKDKGELTLAHRSKRFYNDNEMALITLFSDFGSASGYPAAMKGVLLQICPTAQLVDISHDVERHHIRSGAFLLWMVAPYFPPQTVHCAIVDPTVGTARRSLIVSSGGQLFVGPDNGLLIPAAQRLGEPKVYSIENAIYVHTPVSRTFHGRDIFAPVAAHLATGVPPEEIGPLVTDWIKLTFGQGIRRGHILEGEIIYIDSFGNVITNIAGELLRELAEPGATLVVEAGRKSASARCAETYGETEPRGLIVTVGSHGHVEIAANRDSAAQRLRARLGEAVLIQRA